MPISPKPSTLTQRGAFVSEVLPGSGSAKAGVKAGDIITSLNGKPLNSFAELRSRIATTEPGTKVKLGLLRNGKPLEVEVTLDTSTSSSASAEMITPALEGATLSDGQLKDGGKGIKIDEVVKGSPAAQAGLQKDDVIIGVNRDRVNSIAEMRKVLAAKPAIIALQIVRGNESIYLLMRYRRKPGIRLTCDVRLTRGMLLPFPFLMTPPSCL